MKKQIVLVIIFSMIMCFFQGCGRKNNIINKMYEIPDGAVELNSTIADTYRGADAIVTIISDDGIYDSCVNLDKIFSDRNLHCTVAGVVSIVEPHKDEWNELLKHGTIDLVSHSYDHIRMEEGKEISQNMEALKHEIIDADKWYEDWLGDEQIVFVCPENQMCEKGYEILKRNNFWSVRRGHRGYNSLSPDEGIEYGQWYNLMVQGICDDDVDLTVRNGWIDTAINDKLWLIEMWHNVMPEFDGGYQTILLSDTEEHLNYIEEKSIDNDIWVATYDEAVKYLREKQNSKLYSYIYDGKLILYVELTNEMMSYETFNQPLTVVTTLQEGVVVNDGERWSVSDGALTASVVPGEEVIIALKGE